MKQAASCVLLHQTQWLLASFLWKPVPLYNPLAWILILYIVLVQHNSSFKWNQLFGGHLSRKFRTLFDEWNVMETYQPRALTMGHLFEPEPPTPYLDEEKKTPEADAFRAMRDAHYANEFTFVQKMEAERKAMEQNNTHNSTSQHGNQQMSSNSQSQTAYLKLKEEPKYDPDSYREI